MVYEVETGPIGSHSGDYEDAMNLFEPASTTGN
jgi:hypothetical protein